MNIISSILRRKNIIRWLGYVFSYHVIAIVCTFLAAKIYTGWFEPHIYATIGKLIFLMTAGVGIFGNWLNATITRYIPERVAGKKETAPFFMFVCRLAFFSIACLAILLFIFKRQLYSYLGFIPPAYILLIFLFNTVFFLLTVALQSLNKFGHSSLLKILERIIYLVIAIFIARVFYFKDPAKFLDLTLIKGVVVALVAGLTIIFSKDLLSYFVKGKCRLTADEKRDILAFALPCFPIVIIGIASNWIDFFMVSISQTNLNTGLYFLSVQINNIMMLVVLIPTTVLTPKLTRYLTENSSKVVREYAFKLLPFLHLNWILAIALLIIFAKPIIGALFSIKFAGSSIYTQILMAGNAGMIFTHSLTPFIIFHKETRKLMVTSLIMFLTNVVLAIILVNFLQTVGICISKAVSMFIYPAIVFLLFPEVRKYFQIKIVLSFFIPCLILLAFFWAGR